ncbi:hypothetical protein GCM10009712_11940 [Pseudarthrobacter sulfonivorans]
MPEGGVAGPVKHRIDVHLGDHVPGITAQLEVRITVNQLVGLLFRHGFRPYARPARAARDPHLFRFERPLDM